MVLLLLSTFSVSANTGINVVNAGGFFHFGTFENHRRKNRTNNNDNNKLLIKGPLSRRICPRAVKRQKVRFVRGPGTSLRTARQHRRRPNPIRFYHLLRCK